MRDALAAGFTRTAARLGRMLEGSLSEQQRADLFVANLVREARAAMRRPATDLRGTGTALQDGKLADDLAAQEKWLQAEARGRGFKDIEDLLTKDYPLFEKLAELWRKKHPAEALLSDPRARTRGLPLVSAQSELDMAIREAGKALQQAMDDKRGRNTVLLGRSPHVLSFATGGAVPQPLPMIVEPHLLNKTVAPAGTAPVPVGANNHYGDLAGVSGEDLARAMYRPAAVVEDLSQKGNFTLFTNILTAKGPLVVHVDIGARDKSGAPVVLVKSIYARGDGALADWLNGKDAKRVVHYVDQAQIGEAVTGRLNPQNQNPAFEGRDLVSAKGAFNAPSEETPKSALSPISNVVSIPAFGSPANENYRGLATVQAGLQKLLTGKGLMPGQRPAKTYADLLKWIERQFKGDEADRPMFSRAPAQKTAQERADAIIMDTVGRAAPLDKLAKGLTAGLSIKGWSLERLTSTIYDRAGFILSRYTPEKVKAGVISDYGVPEAVIDQRAMLQGRQRVQLRKAGALVEKLATLTRAESRVAYAWMNEADPQEAARLMDELPADSVQVLGEVATMIEKLSREAIAMDQLSQEAYERNRFAYLRRSYVKHVLPQDEKGQKRRSKTIAILGEQYKGRGLTEAASMRQKKPLV